MTGRTIAQALLGCLEICLFMRRGVGRFGTDMRTMYWSFMVPVLMTPVGSLFLGMNDQAQVDTTSQGIPEYLLRIVLGMIAGLLTMYAMCRALNRMQALPHWITVNNWLSITGMILLYPLMVMVDAGMIDKVAAYGGYVMVVLYGTACRAASSAWVLGVPWQIGGGYALGMLVVQDAIFTLVDMM